MNFIKTTKNQRETRILSIGKWQRTIWILTLFWPILGKKWIEKGPDVISFLSEDFVCL